jgi:hypothetical protein
MCGLQAGGRTVGGSRGVVAYSSRADCVRVRSARGRWLGFQRFDYAALTISGIELVQKIQKEQFKTGKLDGRSATVPQLRTPVLAARIAFLREVSNPTENSSGGDGAAGAPTVSVQGHHQHPEALDESPTQPRSRKKLSG